MRLIVEEDPQAVGAFTADYIKHRINEFAPTADRPFVLGLPTGADLGPAGQRPCPPSHPPTTGSSPIATYQKLVEYHRKGELSFRHVGASQKRSTTPATSACTSLPAPHAFRPLPPFILPVTFNMDEYVVRAPMREPEGERQPPTLSPRTLARAGLASGPRAELRQLHVVRHRYAARGVALGPHCAHTHRACLLRQHLFRHVDIKVRAFGGRLRLAHVPHSQAAGQGPPLPLTPPAPQPENVFIPNGNAADLEAECLRYEMTIRKHGGIELFLGGIGPDGHMCAAADVVPWSPLTAPYRFPVPSTSPAAV